MPKTILIIENDAPFAEEVSGALEAMGYRVRVTGDGKEGLELARELKPDAIVLCVELPKLSGYSICNKLKKDEALKSIPLILTSSEATEEVFDDHRKLKVRAEEYLIKPYVSANLIEKVGALVGWPEAAGAFAFPGAAPPLNSGDEEMVSLEDELALESFAGQPGEELPAMDLDSLPDEPAPPVAGRGDLDDDLKLLDDAFDGLSAPPAGPVPLAVESPAVASAADTAAADEAIERALGVDRPVTSEDLDAASATLPGEDAAERRAVLGGLEDEADLALGALGDAPSSPVTSAFDALDALGTSDEPSAAPSGTVPPAAHALAGSAGAAMLATATGLAAGALGALAGTGGGGLERLEADLAERSAALGARDLALRELKAMLHESESALGEKKAEAASLKTRGDALAAQAKKAEADARAAHEEARQVMEQARAAEAKAKGSEERAAGAEARLLAAEGRCRAAELESAAQRRSAEQSAAALASKSAELVTALSSVSRLAAMEREVERLEAELGAARREADTFRSEAEKRAADLKRRISELEGANTKNEERVVKAYLKIKGDEKVRDKARKALSIALQLLEEGTVAEPTAEKRPRPVPE